MLKKKSFIMILLLFGLSLVFIGTGIELSSPVKNENIKNQTIMYMNSNTDNSTYLSDIEYIADQSYTRYDKIRNDEVSGGNKITLKVENNIFTFNKGIWAHATSQVTYDISKYNYKYFTAFIGLNSTSTGGNGVKFVISTSKDGKDWGEPKVEMTKKPGENASLIKVDLSGAKYLRLCANDNGSNAQDHSVYANARLENDEDQSSAFKSVEEYNEIIKAQYTGQADLTGDIEFNILKRQLIQNVGEFTINSFYNESADNKAALDYLMSNPKALKYYILGGKPAGNNYYKSLTQYSRLYRNYKNDFNNTEVTKYGTVLGDLYLRMATSLSLTHAGLVGLWMDNASSKENQSDSVRRYAIIKYMHKNNLFEGPNGMDYNKWFENYTVEEMRYVMANNIDDQSILWLNAYVRELIKKEGSSRLWPHKYIAYVWPNYGNPVYYAEENKEYFNQLFSIPDEEHEGQRIGLWDVTYTIPGGVDVPEYNLQIPRGTSDKKIYKVWMNMRNKFGTGAVCGGISKTGSNIRGVLGLPDAVVGQPGHAAHINYFQNSNGEGFWGIDNDVSGWAYTGSSGLLGWANAPYASGYTGTYIHLAQEVVNHFDIYEQSQKFVYIADSYTDLAKKEEMYRKALEIQPLNLNAWYGLILTYNDSDSKTEEQYYELAKEIAETLKYYPLPMYQMTNQIKPKLTSQQESYKFTLLITRILKEGSVLPNGSPEVLQPNITRLMANYLLGEMDSTIATFSFDGDDAGKIVLSSRFDGNGVRWDYSLDGKKTWKEVSFSAQEEHKLQLTQKEINSMTSENDLYVHIVGVNYSDENLYKIDIKESAGLPATLFASDLENKLLGAVDSIEWKYNEKDSWTRYKNKQPVLTGDKSVILRMGATDTYLASTTSTTYNFTKDIINNKRKYIPVSHLSLEAVSTEATNQQGNATNALDANYNTRWHSAWDGSDTKRYITVKLDKPYNISAVEFVPAAGGNGKIYDGTVWGSIDGENWMVLSNQKGLTYTNNTTTVEEAIANIKSFDIENPQRVQYIKIVADRTNGNWITARAFNFYEDTTVKSVASFSFDGSQAGSIVLFDDFKNKNWKYSIDGGTTWQKVTSSSHKLSENELEKINTKDKIKIVLDGDKTEYKINIRKGETPEKGYLNDLENRPIAQPDQESLEWKISGEETWTSYKDEEPNVKGTKTLLIRRKATGITTASDTIKYQFTEDKQPKNRKYIPIKHLTMHGFSTQSVDAARPYYAPNAIDGNLNTLWHTDFRYSVLTQDIKPFLTIKLDQPKYISALEFIQKGYKEADPILIKNATVYVSMDGEKWTQAGKISNLSEEEQVLRKINFSKSLQAQYVKLEMETYGIFASISMINLFEDKTNAPVVTPTAKVKYSTTSLTNKNVTATLVEESTDITVTNNGGKKTYTFTKNGTFTFEFVDEDGNKGKTTATVKNIDKTAPTAKVKYSTTTPTNKNVVATLFDASEEIKITNNGGKNTYTFTKNGTFTFEFVDKAGNKGTAKAVVNNITTETSKVEIKYSTTKPTNKNVIATLTSNNNITITNNGGKNTYTFTKNGTFTFEYVDASGNKKTATATVKNIDKTAPTAKVKYSTTQPTNKNVVVTLTDYSEEIKITNNGGKNTYTFTKNGTFTFEFVDKVGNKGTAKAIVNNINKVAPTAKVVYSTTKPTNKNVIATLTGLDKDITIINNGGKNTYTFTKNGTFTFEFKDKAGNIGSVVAIVKNIDKVAPIGKIKYSTTKQTNKDVTVTLDANEEITITNNNGKSSYIFTDNGTFTFEFVDKAGNKGVATATVNNIDKIAPTAKVKYSTTQPTNKNVVATLFDASEEITITNNNGSENYSFEENGTFIFEFVDKAGNKGTAKAIVNNIDKIAPTAKVKYSTTKPTTKDVVVTLADYSEDIKIINNGGKNTYKFTKNGVFTFEFIDKAGNKGSVMAIVNNIKKVSPSAKIVYSTKDLTNKNVTATLSGLGKDIKIINNGGKNTYTFTENGVFTFEFTDSKGQIGSLVAVVNNIDKVAPTANVIYSPTTLTSGVVIATLTNYSEEIKILNNNGKNTYTFKENGKFEFKISDKAGNITIIEAKVTWIDKSSVEKPSKPNKPNKPATSNKPVIVVPSNSNNNKNYVNNQTESIINTLKTFTAGRITLKVPANTWLDNTDLKVKYLELSSIIQEKLGGENEYFEIFVEPQQNNNTSMKMIIDLDPEKKLAGIYKVINNKKVEKLEYINLGNNQIEVDIDSLGEYLISYKDENNKVNDELSDNENDKNKVQEVKEEETNKTLIIITIIATLATGIISLLLNKKSKEEIEFKDI